jgi:undecaprenyl-diphosphatase
LIFGAIAGEVLSDGHLVRFDEEVAATLYAQATLPLTILFLVVAALASSAGAALAGVFVLVACGLRGRWLYVGMWFAAVAAGEILNLLLKELFARPALSLPKQFMDNKVVAYTSNAFPGGEMITSYSFPSGHAMESVIMYGMLAYLGVLGLQSGRARIAITLGGMFLVLSIGFSRMYLGAHYFSDVIGGYAAGGVLLSLFILCTETIRRRNTRKPTNLQSA